MVLLEEIWHDPAPRSFITPFVFGSHKTWIQDAPDDYNNDDDGHLDQYANSCSLQDEESPCRKLVQTGSFLGSIDTGSDFPIEYILFTIDLNCG